MKSQILDVLAPSVMCLFTTLFLWGKAILGHKKQRMIWRIGVAIGAACSLFASIGFVAPDPYNLYPCMAYITGITVMSGCILASMYFQPAREGLTPEELDDLKEGKNHFLSQMAVGAGFIMFLVVILSFTTGQREGQVVGESMASAINRLSVEFSSFKGEVRNRLVRLEAKADSSVVKDSLAREKVYKGQERIFNQKRSR